MRLITLKLNNFKKAKEFVMDTKGGNVSVYGSNATGKTTLVDAFIWLLFNKDSTDRADFQIKTLDEDGSEVHGLEHQVEAELDMDGELVVLRKIYKEKYTKKRGSTEAEFTGHETEYFVNEVPKKKREFEDYIASIIPEKIFKLVTNPLYFGSSVPWKERREIMLSICGDIGNDDVFESKALEHVKELLDSKTTEDALKMLKAQKAKINGEIDEIPIRISEVSNSTPELPQNVDFVKIDVELGGLQEKIIAAEKEKSDLLKNINIERKVYYDKIADAQKELLLIRSDKSKLEMDVKRSEQRASDIKSLTESKRSIISRNLTNIKSFEADLQVLSRQRETLLKSWHESNDQKFMLQDGNANCKACGQTLPEALRNQKLQTLRGMFETGKKAELETIAVKGKMLNAQAESYQKSIDNCKEQNLQLEKELTEMEIPATTFQSDGLGVLDQSINMITARIDDLKANVEKINYDDLLETQNIKLSELRQGVAELEKTLSLRGVYAKNQERIGELKTRQKELSKEYLLLEKQIEGVEQFVKTKVDMQEGKLNGMFETVTFKLFESQLNGGLNEVFETLINGVPYQDANGAAKVNSGIEIINKLCEHYQFTAPLFVDNSESVVKLQSTDSQVIRLVVSENDKSLRMVSQ